MAKVEIYSSPICPFCIRAKKLLKRKGVTFEDIDIFMQPRRKTEMIERAEGRKTVPQIFIDDVGIGGCDELHALEAAGKLDPMLAGKAGDGKPA